MPKDHEPEADFNAIKEWLSRAEANSRKCFICNRIAQGNRGGDGTLRPVRISGVDLAPDTQAAHLARCVGHVKTPQP